MRVVGIIPARMASSRFPGKPLADICGIPMVGHVYFRSKMSKALDDVYIATCDEEIKNYAQSVGAQAVMTLDTHERASDRAAEAVLKIEKETKEKVDVVVMIQGDEPMLRPEMIDLAVEPILKDKDIQVTNLMSRLKTREEQRDPNEVKVVVDNNNYALYFSREALPSDKKTKEEIAAYKQVCIIPFRRDFLVTFNELQPTPLEKTESVDMLRVLEHGLKVKMILTNRDTYSVDTSEELEHVSALMENDSLRHKYGAEK